MVNMISPLLDKDAKCFQNKNAFGDLRFVASDLRFIQLQMRSRSGICEFVRFIIDAPGVNLGTFTLGEVKYVERVDLRILIQKIASAK